MKQTSFLPCLLTGLIGKLPETENEKLLREDLRRLDSLSIKSEEELIHWAMLRWSSCEQAPKSLPAGWCAHVYALRLEGEPSSYSSSDPSGEEKTPFAYLLNQWLQYTGETPRMHNGRHLRKGQDCKVQEVKVNGMKLHSAGMGGPF